MATATHSKKAFSWDLLMFLEIWSINLWLRMCQHTANYVAGK